MRIKPDSKSDLFYCWFPWSNDLFDLTKSILQTDSAFNDNKNTPNTNLKDQCENHGSYASKVLKLKTSFRICSPNTVSMQKKKDRISST